MTVTFRRGFLPRSAPAATERRSFAALAAGLLALFLSAAWIAEVQASSAGITGKTNRNGGAGCGACHSPNATLGVAIATGPASLVIGQSATYSINITGGTAGNRIGINVAASDSTLSVSAANLQIIGDEITHTGTLTNADGAGAGSYSFTYTMPASATAGSVHTIYGAARNGVEWNHAANFSITALRANQAALTALLDGSSVPPSRAVGVTGTLSTSGGSGVGAVTYSSSNMAVCMVSGTTLTPVGVGSCTITATKAQDSQFNAISDTFSLTVTQASQTISFAALANKLTTDPPFAVSATGGASGLPVTFTAGGVCTSSGTNGATISLTAVAGTCTVTASQAGNTNYSAAAPVMQSFTVLDSSAEVFPPNCQMPPGWQTPMAGAFTGWSVANAVGDASAGVCALKSNPVPLAATGTVNKAQIQFQGNFSAGNITFSRRVSSEAGWDCLRVLIDGLTQNLGAPSGCFGPDENGNSGEVPYGPLSIPITSGNHTVTFSYETDDFAEVGGDAAWIDQVNMPLFTLITSPQFAFGTFGQPISYTITASNFPAARNATSLPPGLSFDAATGVISGSPAAVGTFTAMVSVSNPGGANPAASDLRSVSFFIGKAGQSINFPPINNRLTNALPFTVNATGGGSGNPVTFTASGVCASSGVNGSTITLSTAVGPCTVTAAQAGNGNYNDAGFVAQTFNVSTAAEEIFPPACAMPAGWTVPVGAATGWAVSANEESPTGACSLKSMPMTSGTGPFQADIQFTGTFSAGNVSFKFKTSSEPEWKCFQFLIDGVAQGVGGTCLNRGLVGASGESLWISVSIPITAGSHTLRWRYDKDSLCCVQGRDAAWIDDVVLPLFTLTVAKAGVGSGVVTSTPAGINCGSTCSATLSGNVSLSATPDFLKVLSGWSGGGCSGTGACIVAMDASKTVTATFGNATAPTAPRNVVATPGNASATITFDPSLSDGGTPITTYGVNCSAAGQTTVFNSGLVLSLSLTGMTNGVQYSCVVGAQNFVGASPTVTVLVTPRTVPGAPTGLAVSVGDTQATIKFTAPANNGSNISAYTATCTAAGQLTRVAVATASPITITALTNGVQYSCALVATNAAGNGPPATVPVTPRTVPGVPTGLTVTPRDGRAIFGFIPPANDGGSAITGYTVTCAPGMISGSDVASPIVVTGLSNATSYTCSVFANNAAGNSTGANFAPFTPAVNAGSAYWTQVCSGCHGMTPVLPQLNAAGTTATVLSYAITTAMSGLPDVVALTTAERAAIAQYLKDQLPVPATEITPFNTPRTINVGSQISLGTISFEGLEVATPPAHGTLSAFTGTSITYTPTAGYVGPDSFSFRGKRDTPTMLAGDARTIDITVLPPPAPVISSVLTATGGNGAAFSYQIAASNGPTSYGASNLPAGLGVNTMSGLISGTPTVGGTFNVTISATNPGGTGSATLVITLNPAAQTITFPAQSPAARNYAAAPSNTFAINPLATASSALPVSYVPKTPAVCGVSGTTVTMLTAGTCTLGANQAGDASFTVAAEVTRDVTINPILPGAPVIGAATPGNNQALIAFTAPANTGGTGISLYAAACTPSGSGTGMMSPIVVAGLTNGITYTCSVTATNSVGTGPASATVMVTPAPTPTAPSITSANAATFTVNAPGAFSVTASGTPSTFTYAVTMGALPMGVNLNTMSGVLSGTPTQAGMFLLTLSVSNGVMPNASQLFTLTVAKASQSISFGNPGTQTFGPSPVLLSAVATSSLTVSFVSDSMSVCSVSGGNVTLLGVGTCVIRAQQAGNTNFNAAPDVSQSFSVVQGGQTITFGAQTTPRAFAVNGMFAISPLATASSGLAIAYSSLTTSVCTLSGTTLTMVRAGNCSIAVNQAGNASVAAAAQVTQTVVITGSAPGAPTIGSATPGDGKATIAFTAPASDGGGAITGYTATCGGISGSGSASPITVSGLSNGMAYSCSVSATNAFGTSAMSGSVMVTPAALPGATVWANTCSSGGCHAGAPNGTRLNVGGSSAVVLDYVLAHPTALMSGMVTIVNLTLNAQQKADVAAYIRDFIPPVSATTAAGTPVDINVNSQVFLNSASAALTTLQTVTPPTNGMLSAYTGTTVTYTPNPGFVGTDSFTYRATQASLNTDIRSVSITVSAAAPVITSALTASGAIGQAFSYQIAATNAPTSYDATGLPAGLTVSPGGLISGMPLAGGSSNVSISATNAGGTGSATLVITINLTPQLITFGAQSSPRLYSQGGTFAIMPTAGGGLSGNPIVYSSITPAICGVSGTTVTMLSAGICTIAADQAGNATYAAAARVTQSVSITGIAPAAPTIGAATAGNTQATINFTAPVNTGGLPITGYTVNCNGVTASGLNPPLTVSGLVNGTPYTCSVQAGNLAGTSPVSATVMVTPVSIVFTGNVFSRKVHGNGVGIRELPLVDADINGAFTVEPRALGSGHQIVFRFNSPVTSVGSVNVTNAAAMVAGSATPSFDGNDLIVTLTGVADNVRVTVSATGVNGALNVARAVGFLVGDVNGSRGVNAADISAVKAHLSANPATGGNYLFDLNADGLMSNSDVSAVKARSGMVIP